ncbi:MAG: hypothetical protein IPK65_07820 [Gammaproteobacteria bacterium]|nr:hypothetical protein [Gammaproteobacteria bacterium]
MTDTSDKPGDPAQAPSARCTERGMRDTLVNLEEFALMMCCRSSIRSLEILEVVPPGRETPAAPHPRPASVAIHPAIRKKDE